MPLMLRYSFMGRTFVSECKCSMGVVLVQPVMIRRALFCMVCKVLRWESDMVAAHAGEA